MNPEIEETLIWISLCTTLPPTLTHAAASAPDYHDSAEDASVLLTETPIIIGVGRVRTYIYLH